MVGVSTASAPMVSARRGAKYVPAPHCSVRCAVCSPFPPPHYRSLSAGSVVPPRFDWNSASMALIFRNVEAFNV